MDALFWISLSIVLLKWFEIFERFHLWIEHKSTSLETDSGEQNQHNAVIVQTEEASTEFARCILRKIFTKPKKAVNNLNIYSCYITSGIHRVGDLSDLLSDRFIFQDICSISEWITDLIGRKTETFLVNMFPIYLLLVFFLPFCLLLLLWKQCRRSAGF